MGTCTCVCIFLHLQVTPTCSQEVELVLERTQQVIWKGQEGGGSPGENKKEAKKIPRNGIVSENRENQN